MSQRSKRDHPTRSQAANHDSSRRPSIDATLSRRSFLGAAAAFPLAGSLPTHWVPSADAPDRALLVIELVGGNDGLATVIPGDDLIDRRRPTLTSAARAGAFSIDDDFSLHGSLAGLARRYRDGRLAIVQGVGYEPPDRSHFRSRDIWHSADPTLIRPSGATTGWLGRLCDALSERGASTPGLSVGAVDVPLALRGRHVVVPAIENLDAYTLATGAIGDRERIAELAGREREANDARRRNATDAPRAVDAIRAVADEALRSERRLRDALASYRARAEYPRDRFGQALQLAARVVVCGFGTRVMHVQLAGFDTHANQAPTHAALLAQLDTALDALWVDLEKHGDLDDLVVMVHSEFGRRVAENQSHGTDHGSAGPVFVLGGPTAVASGGLFGGRPDLEDLDDGDLRVTCDFRRVYADVLRAAGFVTRGEDATSTAMLRSVLGAKAPLESTGRWAV
jgi:uncharacterized protein (DUF1501 family)